MKTFFLQLFTIAWAVASLTGQSAEAVIEKTGTLHYENTDDFRNQWRVTCPAAEENTSRWVVAADERDGKVLRAGRRGNASAPFEFRVYSPTRQEITVFDVSRAGSLRTYTDFRLVDGPRRPIEAIRVTLALVSPDGSHSYTACVYANNDMFNKSSLRIDKLNFNSGELEHGKYKDNILFTKLDNSLKQENWYRFEFTMTRKNATERSPVNLTVCVYELENGQKGGKRGRLLKSATADLMPNLGKYVQFGMIGYTTAPYCLYTDNFGAENSIEAVETVKAKKDKPDAPISETTKNLINSMMNRRHEYKKGSGNIVLAQDGKEKAVIVISLTAPAPVRFAAQELEFFLNKLTGARFKTVSEIPAGGSAIILGDTPEARKAGIDVQKIARDGFQIIAQDNKIFIAGKDDSSARSEVLFKLATLPDDHRRHPGLEPHEWTFERGTLYGVYQFIEMLGVRWFMPGPKGLVIPEEKNLQIPAFSMLEEPTFSERRISPRWWEDSRLFSRYSKGPPVDPIKVFDDLQFTHKANIVWVLRMKGSSMIYPLNHRPPNNQFEERFGKTHPEYFSLWRGKRDLKSEGHTGRSGELCYSSEGMYQETIKDVDAFFAGKPASERGLTSHYYSSNQGWAPAANYGKMVSMLPHDVYKPCECDKCKGKIAYNRGQGQMSELVWNFVARVAEHVEKRWPGHLVSCLAYSSYVALPLTLERLPDNVVVGICPSGVYLQNPEKYKAVFDLAKSWKTMSNAPMAFWSPLLSRWTRNIDLYAVPMQIPHFHKKLIKDLSGYGRIMYLEMEADNYVFEHLNRYIIMKLLYNPDLDVDLLIDDYCRKFYGPAADIMRGVISDIEKRCNLIGVEDAPRWKIWSSPDIFGPEVMKNYRAGMNDAENLVKETKYAEPVRLFSTHFIGYMEQGFNAFQAIAEGAKERTRLAQTRRNMQMTIPFVGDRKQMLSLPLMGASDYPDFQGSSVELGYDNKFLYLKLVAFENKLKDLKADCKDDKGPVWSDDCFEVMLAPPDSRSYYQIVVNGNGACQVLLHMGDGNRDKLIKPENFKVKVTPRIAYDESIWDVEMEIPLAQFPQEYFTAPWRFNVFRSRYLNSANACQGSGIYLTELNFHKFDEYPKLIFGGK